jgi:hypothetical protein
MRQEKAASGSAAMWKPSAGKKRPGARPGLKLSCSCRCGRVLRSLAIREREICRPATTPELFSFKPNRESALSRCLENDPSGLTRGIIRQTKILDGHGVSICLNRTPAAFPNGKPVAASPENALGRRRHVDQRDRLDGGRDLRQRRALVQYRSLVNFFHDAPLLPIALREAI